MRKDSKDNLLISIALLVIGALFIILRGGFISVVMTVMGASLIVYAIINIIFGRFYIAVAEAVIGIFIIVFGWALVSVSLYIFAVALLIYGIYRIRIGVTLVSSGVGAKFTALCFIGGILNIVLAVLLLFNQGGTVDWIFVVSGIGLILEGIVGIADFIVNKPIIKKVEKSQDDDGKGTEFHY